MQTDLRQEFRRHVDDLQNRMERRFRKGVRRGGVVLCFYIFYDIIKMGVQFLDSMYVFVRENIDAAADYR